MLIYCPAPLSMRSTASLDDWVTANAFKSSVMTNPQRRGQALFWGGVRLYILFNSI